MRTIAFEDVSDAVERLCIDCAYELPSDVTGALDAAMQSERNPRAREILGQLIENARIAREDRIPLCQDTGLAIVFVDLGADAVVALPKDRPGATLIDAIQEGVAAGYDKGLLRKSVVAEPLKDRKNTGTNTPAIVHLSMVPGDRLKISIMAKGGGCENKSAFRVFKPTQTREDVIDWVVDVVAKAGADACPPFVVGVGLGGNFEVSCLLAKKALLRGIGRYATQRTRLHAGREAGRRRAGVPLLRARLFRTRNAEARRDADGRRRSLPDGPPRSRSSSCRYRRRSRASVLPGGEDARIFDRRGGAADRPQR